MPFGELPTLVRYIIDILDIGVVWFVIYRLLMLVKGTKAIQLLKGISVIIIIQIVSLFLGLETLQWLMSQALNYGFLAIIIIFQPEFRRALEQIGRGNLFARKSASGSDTYIKTIEGMIHAVEYMAKRRIGALITIEKESDLSDYVETGIPMDARITSQLLINIFIPNTPLHDGAVIIGQNQIRAAACYLPLSESPFISKELGTRHRAAVGISEVTDSLTLIVSEETGNVSVARNGELYRGINMDDLRSMLEVELVADKNENLSSKWKWRISRDG